MDLIHNTITNNPNSIERVVISGKDIGRHEVTFLKGEWQLDSKSRISLATIQQTRENHYNNLKNLYNYQNHIRLYEAYQDVLRKTGKEPNTISIEEFNEAFPEILVQNENELSTKISEIFLNYRLDEIDLLAKQYSEAEINTELGEKPWDVLRKILETAKLPFDISDPSTNSVKDTFQLKLTHQITGDEVNFYDLSSGEKVLMSLVFYLYNTQEKGVFSKLFLLDEPDAHLHPSMSQQFINVMKRY